MITYTLIYDEPLLILYSMLTQVISGKKLSYYKDRIEVKVQNEQDYFKLLACISSYMIMTIVDSTLLETKRADEDDLDVVDLTEYIIENNEVLDIIEELADEILDENETLKLHGFQTFTLNDVKKLVAGYIEEYFNMPKQNPVDLKIFEDEKYKTLRIELNGMEVEITDAEGEKNNVYELMEKLNVKIIIPSEHIENSSDQVLFVNVSLIVTLLLSFKTNQILYLTKDGEFISKVSETIKAEGHIIKTIPIGN